MRLLNALLLVLLLGLWTGVALADPNTPAEEKEWHLVIDGSRTVVPEVEPNDTCPTGQIILCGDVVNPATIATGTDNDWFTLQNIAGGTIITVATDASAMGDPDVGDSYLELYYNCGSTRVAYDDDGGPGLYSLMTYQVPAGSPGTYTIKVRGYSASYTGYYMMTVTCTVPQPPDPNDTCAGAIAIERCTTGTLAGNSNFDFNDYNPGTPGPSCTGYSANGKDVVYLLNLQAGDQVHLVYDTPGADASFYIVTDCANVSASCVVGADATSSPETIDWTASTAGAYYLILDCYTTGWGGAWTLAYTITCPPPPEQGACCRADGTCYMVLQADCADTWFGGPCDPNPCPPPPPVGACCDPETGNCTLTVQTACPFVWHAEWTSCDPNPCPPPVPTEKASWGSIKANYR